MSDSRIYEVGMPAGVSVEAGLEKVRAKALDAGIRIEGGVEGGSFDGVAQGRYEVCAGRLRLEIGSKPAFLPWSLVEAGLKQVFGEIESVA